jgi:hypothetical protein
VPTKPKKKAKPNSYTPWNCVILAIDPGQKSGVAIYSQGLRVTSGTNHDKPVPYWVRIAGRVARAENIPLIVVIESHVVHGRWNAAGFAGTAESVGVWKEYIGKLEGLKWKPKVLRLPVDTWRKGIYGSCRRPKHMFGNDGRAYWKWMAREAAQVEDDDAAEAILIGEYACKWGKVGEQSGVKEVGNDDQ